MPQYSLIKFYLQFRDVTLKHGLREMIFHSTNTVVLDNIVDEINEELKRRVQELEKLESELDQLKIEDLYVNPENMVVFFQYACTAKRYAMIKDAGIRWRPIFINTLMWNSAIVSVVTAPKVLSGYGSVR